MFAFTEPTRIVGHDMVLTIFTIHNILSHLLFNLVNIIQMLGLAHTSQIIN